MPGAMVDRRVSVWDVGALGVASRNESGVGCRRDGGSAWVGGVPAVR